MTGAAKGRSQGVATFTRPLNAADVAALAELGLEIVNVELVSEDHDGLRWTYGAPYGPGVFSDAQESADEQGFPAMIGVVSAEVVIPIRPVLDSVRSSPDVFVIDLAKEHVGRRWSGADATMNDVFWYLAGWEPIDEAGEN